MFSDNATCVCWPGAEFSCAIKRLFKHEVATIFETFTDEQDAINSFFPDREIKRFDILNFVKEQQQKKS